MDSTIKTRQDAIDRISTLMEPKGMMLAFLHPHLRNAFSPAAVTFSWNPVSHFRIKCPEGGKDIVVASVNRGHDPVLVVNRVAIDCESLIPFPDNEQEVA